MIFTLEALQARHGDSLLLYYGSLDAPKLVVIDGGPNSRIIRPRLDEMRAALDDPDSGLPIRLLMVSHIDDDHIRGVLDLTKHIREASENQEPLPYRIQTLWHNSFDDIVGNGANSLFEASVASVGAASLTGDIRDSARMSRDAAMVMASVRQGRTLRDDARVIGLEINEPGGGLVTAGSAAVVELGDGLAFQVVGPARSRLEELQKDWDHKLTELNLATDAGRAEAAAYVDKSVYNLASIVVLVNAENKTMLLTGDARGDDILAGLGEAELLDANGHLHVDILKVPHHGSDRNVETDFFRRITADHYIFSGDGKHGNPEPATFEMLFTARDHDPYRIHLTYAVDDFIDDYPKAELKQMIEAEQASGKPIEIRAPVAGNKSLMVNLADPYTGP